MKSRFYFLAITFILTVETGITSCNSPVKKIENKNAQVDDRDLKPSATEFHGKKIATPEEWNVFMQEQELKTKEVELWIAVLREKMSNSETEQKIDTIFQVKIVKLEQKNNILRAKIKAYELNQTDWKSFKRQCNNDLEELGMAFKDLTADYKKENIVRN